MNPTAAELLKKIQQRDAVIGIIGLGYVGLPLALAFAEKGFRVVGFDVDSKKTDMIGRGECYIEHLDGGRLVESVNAGRFAATTDFDRLDEPDAILICVPTPLTPQRDPDMSYVVGTTREIAERLRPGQLIVLESTTYPGTTEELLKPILESSRGSTERDLAVEPAASNRQSGTASSEGSQIRNPQSEIRNLTCGEDFFLAFSPEREDPGNPDYGTTTIPKVVGGVDHVSGELAEVLYDQVVARTVRVSSARVAEATKLTENIFRAVNIALVNELKVVYDRMGIDVWEVLDAASTKPFGFMRFNPGPGWGGHCIAANEWTRVRGRGLWGVYRAEGLFDRLRGDCDAVVTRSGAYLETPGLEALAIDAATGEVGWFPVSTVYRGRFHGQGVKIRTDDNRRLTVTGEHPMLVLRNEDLEVVPARMLGKGDALPILSDIGAPVPNPTVDLIDVVPERERRRVWVRPIVSGWHEHEETLKRRFGWTIRDSLRSNSLRLDRYLEVEDEVGVDREHLVLLTGMGRARREWPSRLELTPEFARFVGYYLAEGCITRDRNALRVRLTFNRGETSYIEDARQVLYSHGFPTTVYQDSTWFSTTVKASSLPLGWLLDGHWQCGSRSEEMRAPEAILRLSPDHKRELLAGLLRGDGDVWTRTGWSSYKKHDRTYTHRNATAVVGFFSSSPVLLEQVVHLLQDLGFQPRFKKGSPQIRLQGARTIDHLIPLFDGDKRSKLETAQAARRRRVSSLSDRRPLAPGLRQCEVASLEQVEIAGHVYSLEVEGARTFATSSGIAVHNCIPLDPFYLSWKAREHGVTPKFIELAGDVNVEMPEYVVGKLQEALNDCGKAVKGSKVLVLGIAYKKDIDDPRESPAFEIIDKLLGRGAAVSYHDPHIAVAPRMRSWPDLPAMESVELTPDRLADVDAAVIVTDHSAVDYDLIAEHATLIIDTRGVYREPRPNVVKA